MWLKDIADAADRVMNWMGDDNENIVVEKIQPTSGGILFTLPNDGVILWREGSDDVFGYWNDGPEKSGWENNYNKWKKAGA